jgi:hypothetical protein
MGSIRRVTKKTCREKPSYTAGDEPPLALARKNSGSGGIYEKTIVRRRRTCRLVHLSRVISGKSLTLVVARMAASNQM